MYEGEELTRTLESLGFTHVIWVPDSTLGTWEAALEQSRRVELVRVCREGECWPLAAGLWAGGQQPLVMMQSTGLYESGDAMRNVLFDLKVPLLGMIGIRNWLTPDSKDSAKRYIESIIGAWNLNHLWIVNVDDKSKMPGYLRDCNANRRAGLVLMAEESG